MALETLNCDTMSKDDKGLATIHYAAKQSLAEAVKILAELNKDIDIPAPADYGEVMPLMIAVSEADLAAVQHLLDAGANVNYQANKLSYNISAIHSAQTAEMIGCSSNVALRSTWQMPGVTQLFTTGLPHLRLTSVISRDW